MTPENRQHPREIQLRKLLAGESLEAVTTHLATCVACKARVKELEEQQQSFEAAIPFERFAAGVDRAMRQPRATPKTSRGPARILVAIAATVLALAGASLVMPRKGAEATHRIKGGSEVEVVVAAPGNGPQRIGSPDPLLPEALGYGERVRIGFRAGGYRYLAAVSIDHSGEISAVYPRQGSSIEMTAGAKDYLPDSLEFTGQGLERLVVVMTQTPLEVEEVRRAAKAGYDQARGNLSQLGMLDLPGEQFHRTFLKP